MKRSLAMPEMTRERARKWIRRHEPWDIRVGFGGIYLVPRGWANLDKREGLELARAIGNLVDECSKAGHDGK